MPQRARSKARKVRRNRKEQEEPVWLEVPGEVDAVPRRKAVKHARFKFYDLPRNRKQQEKDFERLGIPPAVYGTLWEWGAKTEAVEPVVKFLKRVNFWVEGHQTGIQLAFKVCGRARDPYYQQKHRPEQRGEIHLFLKARKDLVFAIVQARMFHLANTHAHDTAIEKALPHLETALNYLTEWPEIEVDPELPKRRRGRKPRLIMPLREGEEPRPVRRRVIERRLKDLLLPLHPRRSRVDVKFLARKFLDHVLPIRLSNRQRMLSENNQSG